MSHKLTPFGVGSRLEIADSEKGSLQRLFSTFATGYPGAGLLLMRLVAGAGLVVRGITGLANATPVSLVVEVVAITAGVSLIAGLWTPVTASLVGVVALSKAFSDSDPWACILLAAMGVGLALLGPGRWSLDARLFGFRRIEVRERRT